MKNKPNAYKVEYLVEEGNHYAGGMGKRYAEITDLEDLVNYREISYVKPVFVEYGENLTESEIAKHQRRAIKNQQIAHAKMAVEKAQANLDMAKHDYDRLI